MKKQAKRENHHKIEFIFPVAVFFFFTLCALIIILFSARVYQSTVEDAGKNYTANTSLSYLREKIYQHDETGSVKLGEVEGFPALLMTDTFVKEAATTAIYASDGALRELFVQSEMLPNTQASAGAVILPVKEFSIETVNDRLLSFSCTDEGGRQATALVGIY